MPSHPDQARVRLGELLVRRRIELDPRYRNRRTFTDERAPGLYRIINDIELGRRDNYEPGTLAALEAAYDIAPGSIGRAMEGGELEPPDSQALQPEAAAPEPAPGPAVPADADMTRNIMVTLTGPEERRLWAAIRRRLEVIPSGRTLLTDPAQAALWPPETGDGRWGGAPVELTPEAVRVLDSIPVDVLFPDPVDNAAARLVLYEWPERIGVAAAMRGRLGRPTVAARRAG